MRNADFKDIVKELEILSEVWGGKLAPFKKKNLPVIYSNLEEMARSDTVIDFLR